MATGTPGTTARQLPYQVVHTLRFTVNWNDPGIAAGNNKQFLPAGAIIIGTDVNVVTPFNAATTNTISVGTVGDSPTNIVNAQTSGAVGLTPNIVPSGTALGPLATDKQVQVSYAQTGAAATAGKAIVIVKYVPNTDQ